tara:strand:+ start:2123 stop:3913 length:1791 start_codon:yes stop_codon:yes gene_type:complete
MALVGINTGTAANAGDGSTLRQGANIVNANFTEIYDYFGDGTNLTFTGGKWIEVATGINTLSYVGIGTTNPTDALTVLGGVNATGVITGSKFSGILSATDAVVSGVGSFNGNVLVGAGITLYANSGFMSATKYFGDGSALLSVPSGLGTALSEDTGSALNKIYYINSTLSVGSTITVDPPDTSQVAFTNHPNVVVDSTYDLIVADGDDFIPDILGIGSTGVGGVLSGGGGRVRADNYSDKGGAGAPTFPHGINISGIGTVTDTLRVGTAVTSNSSGVNVTGVVTATGGFVGALTGDVNGDVTGALTGTASSATVAVSAYGLLAKPNITVDLITADDIVVGGALTVTGNMTVDGTQTIVNTSTLDIADKTVGIASTTAATNVTANNSGIEIYASSSTANNNKTILWKNDNNAFTFSNPVRFKGVQETVSAATTYTDASGNVVLELDLEAASVYTYTMPSVWSSGRGSNIGIVSFKNMPGGTAGGMTLTLLTTQGAAHGGGTGYANTNPQNGIGVTCMIIPKSNDASVAGIQTRAQAGGTGLLQSPAGITTVTLSPGKSVTDFISFFIHYDGASLTTLSSYKVYVTKNGGFGWGSVGI